MLPIQRILLRSARPTIVSRRAACRPQQSRTYASVSSQEAAELLSKGLLKDALPLYTTLAKEDPSNAEYLANQAVCLANQPDKTAAAEALAAKANAMSGGEPGIIVKQAHVLREVGKAELSVKFLESVSRWLADDHDWNFEMGKSLCFNWARYGPAIMHFNKALEVKPKDVTSLYWRGMALHWSERGNGFDWLTDENLTGDVREPFFKGLRSYREGKYQEALSYLEQASVGMRPHDNADVWSWRGEANLALGNLDKAMECFDKSLELNPKCALSMHGKGEVYLKQGQKKEWEEWLTKATTTDRLYHKSDYFRQKVPLVPVA